MRVACRVPLLALMAASFVGEACIWHGDRALDDVDAGGDGEGGFASGSAGAAGGTGMGGSAGAGGIQGIGGAAGGAAGAGMGGGTGTGGGAAGSDGGIGSSGDSGQGGSIDASPPETGAADLGDVFTPPPTCGPAGTATKVWSFATDVEGWDATNATLTWTGAAGDPVPGALQVNWTGTAPVDPRRVEALGDLHGHIVTARVWVTPGAAVGVKVFVQTGSRLSWADGGQVFPPPGQWTCVTLDVDNPGFSKQQYDASDVEILGVELQTAGSGHAYIDQVEY